ncbi:expressed unknown protein [Seminavis robusta]|uniref:Uncharacterized protein n=1 Tax=Seminavis robusta TaxID=568900 RepID=A0A9N8E8W8_9STRA|nr:expressed unknown protein [Seminavis robusta]|eukprot:Sro752_g197200.1 n/a (98) ;mRNA; f:29849-30142
MTASSTLSTKVLATSRPVESSASYEGQVPAMPRRSRTHFSPMYSAMLSANTMRDCSQVQAMMTQCLQNHQANRKESETSFVCQTAEQYFHKCAQAQA